MREIRERGKTMENEIVVNENVETMKGEEKQGLIIKDFSNLSKRSTTKSDIFTNITNNKKIFNLENKVDNLLNDMEGSIIEVKEVLIKRYEKPLSTPKVIKEAVIDSRTGEVLEEEVVRDTEITMACILVDKNDVSYATGSKVFTIQMMRYIEMFGISDNGFLIKIVKNKQEKGKSLGFELVD